MFGILFALSLRDQNKISSDFFLIIKLIENTNGKNSRHFKKGTHKKYIRKKILLKMYDALLFKFRQSLKFPNY